MLVANTDCRWIYKEQISDEHMPLFTNNFILDAMGLKSYDKTENSLSNIRVG